MWILTGVILYWHAIRKIDTSKQPFEVYYIDGKTEALTEQQSLELQGTIGQMGQPQRQTVAGVPLVR